RNPTLTWNGAAGNYDVYFGTSSSPAFIGNQIGSSYTPGGLAANTTYYWQIVPRNENGPAIGCIVRSFTTGTSFNYCSAVATSTIDYTSAFSTSLATSNISYTATSNPTNG